MCCLYDSQNRFMVMVLAHLMQALSASRPRSSIGTQGILISYCVMRILMKSLRSALCIITNGALWLLLSTVLLPPILRWYKCPPFLSISYLKISQACSRFVSSVSYLLSKALSVKLSAFMIIKYSSCLQRVGRL